MAIRCRFESSCDVGAFAKLTNSYCLVGQGGSENFYSTFESELGNHIPVVHASIANTKIIGRLITGNKNGLLVPSIISDNELKHLRNSLPENIKIRKIDDRLSALGNCISCNDFIALVHPEFDKESEEIIADILGVEVFKTTVAGSPLVGTYSVFNNLGGIVHPATTMEEYEELANLMQVPIGAATVNRGSELLGSGLVANDWTVFCGMDTTSAEIDNIEKILKIKANENLKLIGGIKPGMGN
jgi:translation initiation factor 6